jgi:hypothetical protein
MTTIANQISAIKEANLFGDELSNLNKYEVYEIGRALIDAHDKEILELQKQIFTLQMAVIKAECGVKVIGG